MALDAMLAAIHHARETILLEMYIFADDEVGRRFLAALVAARERGVRVRVMVDALGSITLPGRFWEPLVEKGGEFRWFNAFQTARRYGYRNHRKLFVADERVAIIGGFNISEEYHGDGVLHGWRDLGMELRGPVIPVLVRTFNDLFSRAAARPEVFFTLRRRPDTEVEGENWRLLLSGPGRGHHALRRSLARDLSRARHVQIICAYFAPTRRIRRAFRKVIQRGGRVELILAGKSDVFLSQLASQSLYSSMMRDGLDIYEYEPQILHAKLFIIDDEVYVGSANLDARSLKLNYELLLRLDDPAAARQARAIFEHDWERSRRVRPAPWRAGRGWWRRLLEKIAYMVVVHLDPYLTRLPWHLRAEETARRFGNGQSR